MPNSKTDNEILMNRINERKNGMKKTAAILASIAAMSLCGLSASAADGDNIIDGVLNGAEEIVDGVVSGAEEIITPAARPLLTKAQMTAHLYPTRFHR